MSTTIKLRRSAVPGNAPTIEQLDLGELAINTFDGNMFIKRQQGAQEEIVKFHSSNPVDNVLHVHKGGSDANTATGETWDDAFLTVERALEVAWERNGQLTLIEIGPGEYTTQGHLDVPDNTHIKSTYRTVFFRPEAGFEQRNVFRLGSGCFVEGLAFEGWQLDSLDNPSEGFAFAFRPGAVITRAPYVHKVVVRTDPYWGTIAPPLDRANANPLIGVGAGVVIADGSVCSPYSVYPNFMTWGATPVSHNGIGYCAKNGALINAVNAISIWAHKHFLALSGGQIILSGCSTQFGDFTMVSQGSRFIIQPDEQTAILEIQTAAWNDIVASSNTIIETMWTDLVANTFTTGWSEEYETLTRRDAGSFLQSIGWVLQSANEKPFEDFIKGLFDPQGIRVFEASPFDYDKSYRDTQTINEAVAYDMLFDSNFRSITAAKAFYRSSANTLITTYKNELVYSIEQQKAAAATYLSSNSLTRSNALYDEILDIINNGEGSSDAFTFSDPTSYDTGFFNARRLLVANKNFIQEEIIEWIQDQIDGEIAPFTSAFVYDSVACRRDVGFVIDALTYDLTYGGNLETYNAAVAYFVGNAAQYGSGEKEETVAAYQRLRSVISDVVQGILITKASGNALTQDNSGTAGTAAAATFTTARINEIIATLISDGVAPVKILPDTTWPDAQYQTSFSTLINNKRNISNAVMKALMLEYKTLLGAFIFTFENMRDQINALTNVGPTAENIVNALVEALISTLLDPNLVREPSTITAIGHTWTAIMSGVALTKIPPARNFATIEESILELDNGIVIASGQDDQGSALFIGGMKIDADTGELTGPPFEQSVNRIATRTAIARSF